MSGSDCGHVFFWNKQSGNLVHVIEADKHVVNCVQENPRYPFLATSGIDYDVKVWQPTLECEPEGCLEKMEQVAMRNKTMLEDTKDTIFIPVQFMGAALRYFGGPRSGR